MKKLFRIFATLLAVALVASSFAACRLWRDADDVKQLKEQKKFDAEFKEMMSATALTINEDITVSGAYFGFFYSSEYNKQYSDLSAQAEEAAASQEAISADSALSSDAQTDSAADSSAEIVVDKALVKQNAIDSIISIKTAYAKAMEAQITLTDEDMANIDEQVASFKTNFASSGMTYYDALKMLGTNAETVDQIFKEQYMGNLYYASLVKDKFVTAKHILINIADETSQDAAADSSAEPARTPEEAKAEIEAIKAQLDGGADFDKLMAEKGEDPGAAQSPNGYTFAKGQMVPEFEEAAFAMEVGTISDIVESSYGYHILKKYETSLSGVAEALSQVTDPEVSDIVNAETEALKANATFAEIADVIAYFEALYK